MGFGGVRRFCPLSCNAIRIRALHYYDMSSSDQKSGRYAGGHSGLSSRQLAHAIIQSRAQSASMNQTNSSMPMFHEPLPVKSSILSRPLKSSGMMTKENLDSQFERDSMKWERKRAAYQQAAQSPAHNHGPGTKSLLEQGHIASRGTQHSDCDI